MRLFFVHTPFQMLIAQNLVISEKLSNNVLVLSYTSKQTKHYYEVFDLLVMPELWSAVEKIGELNVISQLSSKPFSSYCRIRWFLEKVGGLIRTYSVDDVYFGDINHFSYVLLAERFKQKVRINFFEEGLSHYLTTVDKAKYKMSLAIWLKQQVARIVFGVLQTPDFARYIYATQDCPFLFNIHRKYSSFEILRDPFDKCVKLKVYQSEALRKVVELERSQILLKRKEGLVLFLSSTATAFFNDPVNDELLALSKFLEEKTNNWLLLVKFHPKDSAKKKAALRSYLERSGIDWIEVFKDTSLPIETLLGAINVDLIVSYFSSSMLYAQVMDKKVRVQSLLPIILADYRSRNTSNEWVEKLWMQFSELHVRLLSRNI